MVLKRGLLMNKNIKSNIILNIIRTGSAVVFPLITFPYISRVLEADNYGKVNFSASIISYFTLLAAMGVTNYAIREGAVIRNKQKEFNVFVKEVFTINMITTLFAYLLLGILMLSVPSLHGYALLIGIQSATFIFATIGVEWVYSIYEDYFYITIRSLIVQVISVILLFTFVKRKEDYIIYAIITVLSSAGASIFNFFHASKYVKLGFVWKTRWRVHIGPMVVMFLNSLTISIYSSSDTTILGFMKGDTAVGIYSVAVRIYTIIKQLLNSINTVILPRVAALVGNNEMEAYYKLIEKVIKALLTIVLPAIVGLFMLSKEIILLIAGKEYVSGYISLRILSLALVCAVFACTFVYLVLVVYKKDRQYLQATVASAIANVILNFVAIPIWGINGAAVTTLLAEGIVLFIAIRSSRGLFRLTSLKRTLISCGIGCLWIVATCIVFIQIDMSNILRVLFAMLISGVGYAAALVGLKNEIIMEVLNSQKIRKIFKRNK